MYVYMSVLFVFFFKQKTAYEMRISDWSSDVCSSDLISLSRIGRSWVIQDVFRLLRVERHLNNRLLAKRASFNRNCAVVIIFETVLRPDNLVFSGLTMDGRKQRAASDGIDQIGRASCRERVGQYV